MANFAVHDYTTSPGTHAEVAALLETKLETIDDAKTIRLIAINPLSRDRDLCVGVLIYDA